MRVNLLFALMVGMGLAQAFQASRIPSRRLHRFGTSALRADETSDYEDNADLLLVKKTLEEEYPTFYQVVKLNDAVWKALAGVEGGGFTIFAPNQAAFQALGQGKVEQLLDPRNLEQAQKIGSFHVIAETVSADELFNSGGVMTLAGSEAVPVERSTSGGMFGFGGKEDGGVTIGGSKVVKSVPLAGGVLHETDGLVSPNILWRYIDQLRIPGSK